MRGVCQERKKGIITLHPVLGGGCDFFYDCLFPTRTFRIGISVVLEIGIIIFTMECI